MTDLIQSKLAPVTHPLIADMYLKKDFGSPSSHHHDDVLVIEAKFPVRDGDIRNFNACLSDLLSDLPELQREAEAAIGHFDRVDIRYMH